jgi:Protein of unknown function (DUF2804)
MDRPTGLSERLPVLRGTRPLKRWRYVGMYTPELMLCVGEARVGVIPQRWWALALPDGTLRERTSVRRGGVRIEGSRVLAEGRGVRIELELREGDGVETTSPHGGSWIWTRKQAGVPARGMVSIDGEERPIEAEAFIDDSAGYHARHTAWEWSAGNGRLEDGRAVAWNLVRGVHDAFRGSERRIWIDGEPSEVGPVHFAEDLSCVTFDEGGALDFSEWSAREDHTNLLLFGSDYRQPFGTFRGELPGGLRVAEGYGVMEEHDVRW